MFLWKKKSTVPKLPNRSTAATTALNTTTVSNNSSDQLLDYYAVLGICGLVGYEHEINHCIGLCRDVRQDYNLLLTVSSVKTYRYRTKQKHRLMFTVMIGNYPWFSTLYDMGNRTDIVNMRTKFHESLYHLLVGHYRIVKDKITNDNDPNDPSIIYRLHYSSNFIRFIDWEALPDIRFTLLFQFFKYKAGKVETGGKYSPEPSKIFDILIESPLDIDLPLERYTPTLNDPPITKGLGTQYCGYTFFMLVILYGEPYQFYQFHGPEIFKMALQDFIMRGRIDFSRKGTIDGKTALHLACESRFFDSIEVFLSLPTSEMLDLNITDSEGNTPFLTIANSYLLHEKDSCKKIKEFCKYSHRINFHHVNNHNENALYLACSCNHLKMVEYLFQNFPKIDVNTAENQDGYNAFTISIVFGYKAIVKELLVTYGDRIDIKHRIRDNKNVLCIAATCKDVEIMKLLSDRYPKELDYTVSDHFGDNALLIAVKYGHVSIVKELLKYRDRFDIHHRNMAGRNVFHLVSYHHEDFEMYLPNGNRDDEFEIPVANRTAIMHLLCQVSGLHADLEVKDEDGNTPYDIAKAHEYTDILNTLETYRTRGPFEKRKTNSPHSQTCIIC